MNLLDRLGVKKAAALIVLFYLVVQLAGLKTAGLTDDDDFYVPAGISYARWLGRALTFDGNVWSKADRDAAFQINNEHPPVAKYVFGICHALFGKWLGPTDGARVGTVLFSTMIAAFLLALAISHLGQRRGLAVGGLAVVFLLAMPRFYFHSHAATLDVPVAAMYLASVAFVLWGERSTRAAILAGVVFGLASATKLNAPFLVFGYLVFIVLTRRGRTTEPRGHVPLAFVSMCTIGPLVFLASWPWLWSELFKRVAAYVGFHLNHYGIYFLYFGRIYEKDPFAPWHASFVMAAVTVPVATSVLAFVGIRYAWAPIAARLRFRDGPDDDHRKAGDLLLMTVLQAGLTVATVAFSGGAKYGGEKLFMPFFPFWALLAGWGAWSLYEVMSTEVRKRWIAVAVIGLAVASSSALALRSGGYALSQYNALAGGTRGATALGFERQYYDIAFRDLVAWLNAEAPKNARIHFLPNNWEYVRTYKWYRQAGELREDLQVVQSEAQADWIIVSHERRFARYAEDLQRYRRKKLLREKLVDGTPIWSVVQAR
ncbi:glycosyltransferase family 39 protein [Myxococcota bacterium]|nr:glycosyltransferase family 39 protein [Myxococcota bacterium]